MIRINDLHKRYDERPALRGLNLTVAPGEVYALLGPNGAGKTTTINTLLGFEQPDSGSAMVNGVDVSRDTLRARRQIAYIPEQVQLYPRLSGVENLDYFHRLSDTGYLSGSALRACLLDAGLQEEALNRRVSAYSKGMRQKVGIAIAMARQAPVMLLDEPTSGLDPQAAWEFGQSLHQLAGRGVAILMATHDLFRAREIANRVGILKAGTLIADMDAAALAASDLEQVYLQQIRQPTSAGT
jgi:ABC-2 type transport system ATP-binding protein